MSTTPLVSVIIPTYNYAHYITEAIEKILKQTYPSDSIEIIIVDDGSTDNTKSILQSYVENGVVQYYYQTNKGKANATATAIKKCNGKYIFNLDADDFFFETKIEKTVQIFESDAAIVHVATAAKILNQDTQVISEYEKLPHEISERSLDGKWLLNYFLSNNILYGGGSTYAAKSSALQSIAIPEGVDMYIDEFLIFAVLPFGNSYFIGEALSIWRGHGSNYSESSKTKEEQIRKSTRLLKSSEAVLDYLKKSNFDKRIINFYELKHTILSISSKEAFNKKSITDIFDFGTKVLFKIRPNLRTIKKYQVLNRLLPMPLYRLLKKHKTKVHKSE